MARTTKHSDKISLETALEELQNLVEQMEAGGLPLETSLKNFERGIHLINHCQKTLKTAEQKVQLLTEKNGAIQLVDYENTEDLEEE